MYCSKETALSPRILSGSAEVSIRYLNLDGGFVHMWRYWLVIYTPIGCYVAIPDLIFRSVLCLPQ